MLLYNYISYGNAFTSGYGIVRGENFDFSQFNFLNELFSPQRGWFVYSPVYLLGVIGNILAFRRHKLVAGASLFLIFAIALIYGFWPAWWGGGSFGNRFMLVAAAPAAVGIGLLWHWTRNKSVNLLTYTIELRFLLKVAIIVLACWSVMLTVFYRITPVATLRPGTDTIGNMRSGDRYTPVDMIGYQARQIRRINFPSGLFRQD